MFISDLLNTTSDVNVKSIIDEREFDRFSRTTSEHTEPCCVYVASRQYINTIPSNATMVITTQEIADLLDNRHFGLCITDKPKATYFRCFMNASDKISQDLKKTKIHCNCKIGKYTSISENNVSIGNNVVIEDFVTIYENVSIEDNCIIRSGSRIGVEGYNFFNDNDELIHLRHYGQLVLRENVEVGCNSVIEKSLYPGDITIIGHGTKIANHCAIGHDCKIGRNVMVYANSMIAGFTEIGNDTHIAMNVSVKNGTKIGSNVQVDMGSVVIRDIPDNHTVFGVPARRVISPR